MGKCFEACIAEDRLNGAYASKKKHGRLKEGEDDPSLQGVEMITQCDTTNKPDGSTEYQIEWFYNSAETPICMKISVDANGVQTRPTFTKAAKPTKRSNGIIQTADAAGEARESAM